ncbi:hypothetical protein ACWGB8_02240 [Kitasatospora sp. NPDC054939]
MRGIVSKLVVGVAGTGMAVAVAAVAVGPRVSDWYDGRTREQTAYATGTEAKADRRAVPPSWLPDDARAVQYLRSTSGDDRLLRATVPGGRLPAGCTATETGRTTAVTVRLRAGWFPTDVAAKRTGTCGHYNVTVAGDQLYAWQDGAAVQAAARTGRH